MDHDVGEAPPHKAEEQGQDPQEVRGQLGEHHDCVYRFGRESVWDAAIWIINVRWNSSS